MNIQRFLLPATIAATAHVALLWAFPPEPWTPPPHIVEVSTGPLPPKPDDQAVAPLTEETTVSAAPVKPLPGGPTPPELDPPAVPPKGEWPRSPEEVRPQKTIPGLKTVPIGFGPGEAGLPGPGDWDGRQVFSRDKLDREPRATVQPAPAYPLSLKQAGIAGSATVEFEVNTAGEVVRAKAVSFTHREFAGPAVRAVLKWRFEPGRRHGEAVPFRMVVPIEFGLAD